MTTLFKRPTEGKTAPSITESPAAAPAKRKSAFVRNEPGCRPYWRPRTPEDDAREAAEEKAQANAQADAERREQTRATVDAYLAKHRTGTAPKAAFKEAEHLRANATTFIRQSFRIELTAADRVTPKGFDTVKATVGTWCRRMHACTTAQHRRDLKDDLLHVLADDSATPKGVEEAMTISREDFQAMDHADRNHVMAAGFKLRD